MKRYSSIAGHLSAEELQRRMKEADSIDQFRRYQVIYLRLTYPAMPVGEVAKICSVPYRTAIHWTWLYNHNKIEDYLLACRGGRRNCHLPEAAEAVLLRGLYEKSERGQIITVQSVKQAAEQAVGHELPKDYAYDILHRHRWRKGMPPASITDKQDAIKRTPRNCWMSPESDYPKQQPQ